MTDTFSVTPVAVVEGCYPTKFGVPRQPGLAPSATARLILQPPFDAPDAVRGLDEFSHLWLTFIFHQSPENWHPLVRPPRLGGNRKVGVFASRATHRPNRLGLSLVEAVSVSPRPHPIITIRGHDLIDGTPVLDIKPYLPWADGAPLAKAGFAPKPPVLHQVTYTPEAKRVLEQQPQADLLASLIEEVLSQDPRPAYHRPNAKRHYGIYLKNMDVHFQVSESGVHRILTVTSLRQRQDLP